MSAHGDEGWQEQTLAAGASATVQKSGSLQDLLAVLRRISDVRIRRPPDAVGRIRQAPGAEQQHHDT